MKKILITGANGFIGRNLISRLNSYKGQYQVYAFDIENTKEDLRNFTKDCDFVFNFAAVHRPKDVCEFDKVNHVFFDDLLEKLKEHGNFCPVLYTSSIQATNGTEYGNSKLSAEQDLRDYEKQTGGKAIVYRLTNTFGKWATPNHHSVVATFCYNLIRGIPLYISDKNHKMQFYYIDDVIDSFISQIQGNAVADEDGIYRLSEDKIFNITLGELVLLLTEIKEESRGKQIVKKGPLIKERLRETYLSYLNEYENNK